MNCFSPQSCAISGVLLQLLTFDLHVVAAELMTMTSTWWLSRIAQQGFPAASNALANIAPLSIYLDQNPTWMVEAAFSSQPG